MSKKIGIITFHCANNYGAVLQCYALQETLSSLGYDPIVIDYRQPFIETRYNPIRWDIMHQVLARPRLVAGYLLKVLPERWKVAKQFNKFRNRYLHCTNKISSGYDFPQNLDIYIVGSDQVWGVYCTGNIKDEVYFGEFSHNPHSKIYGYAISSSISSIQGIGEEELKNYVNNFTVLSFREKAIRDEVEKITGIKGRVDLDPALLLPTEKWKTLVRKPPVKEKYILTYFFHDGCDSPEFVANINAFASKQNIRIINVSDIAKSPIDFLSAVAHAHIVVSTSFHAIAFSIIFRKQFFALRTSEGLDIRNKNLLFNLCMPERFICVEDLPLTENTIINYDEVYKKLDSLKQDSLSYLGLL